jgi:putative flippase GtrA
MTAPIKRQLGIFLIVGLLTILIDFLIYCCLIYMQPFGLDGIGIAKGISFIGGTIFSFFANRFWTFNQQSTTAAGIFRFMLVYVLGFIANIVINHLCIKWFSSSILDIKYILISAFLLATGISASINFIGMKFFVFTDDKVGKTEEILII